MPRPIVATVDVLALQRNLAELRRRAGTARVWAVVKANAYGHGIERVWPALRAADGLACLDLAEARLLRELGWRGPLLLLEGYLSPETLSCAPRCNCGTWCTTPPSLTGWLRTKPSNHTTCTLS